MAYGKEVIVLRTKTARFLIKDRDQWYGTGRTPAWRRPKITN